MEIQEYLFSQLLCVYDDEFKAMSYGEQYELVPQLYLDFTNSGFYDVSKSEYDCIVNYLDAGKYKVSRVAHEIVEEIFNMKAFDDIDADVWALVSKRVGFPFQIKVATTLSDAKDFNYTRELEHRLSMVKDDASALRKFIYDKGLGKYFKDSDDEQKGYVFINNIDIACDLKSNESLSWKLYKQIID